MATTKITSPDLFNLESLNTALKLPSGTTAQRPTSPSTGEWRYNTTTNLVEFWDGGAWRDLQSEDIPPINSENFNTVLYTGNGSTQSITGVGFKPDWLAIKDRSSSNSWRIFDSSRGLTSPQTLFFNLNFAEDSESNTVSSFDADGFTMGSQGGVNTNGNNYVAYCWKANGGTTSSNTDGTIASTVQVNSKAGFSIVSNTGNGVQGATIGHGLGVAPELIILKDLTAANHWLVGNSSSGWTKAMHLDLSNADNASNLYWADTAPTSTVYSVGFTGGAYNVSGNDYISYCFASVAGYSKISSYTGNGSANGPIVNTGFEPAMIIIKRTDSVEDWKIIDNKRGFANTLEPNEAIAEETGNNSNFTVLSNGFQIGDTDGDFNANGGTYLYIAFGSDASAAPALADSFANKLYTGTGSSQSITGLGFSPNLVWIKGRTNTASHQWFDTIRGATYQISSDTTGAQTQNTQMLTSFDTDGFSLGNQSSVNGSGVNYVAWNWKASPVPTINTDGTRQAIVSANAASGFSIMKYTGDGNTATIGHGLSSAPEIIFVKKLTGNSDWPVYASGLTSAAYRLVLSSSDAQSTTNDEWNSTAPTSTVISVGSGGNVSDNGATFIAYCFTSISGFSKIGSYTGNSSTQAITGLGFSPNWVLLKETDGVDSWELYDTARGATSVLYPNGANAEGTNSGLTSFDSDGFTLGSATSANESGKTYIYMAFKENPTPYPLAGNMSFLTLAGGGGGGNRHGGGGGAGGLRTSYGPTSGGGSSAESDITLASGTYTITVGGGGAGVAYNTTAGVNGTNSVLSGSGMTTITSDGGGGGGISISPNIAGSAGGSGGGGGSTSTGGSATANQGKDGGQGTGQTAPEYGGGGGGGALAIGNNGSGSGGGNGGNGLPMSITGSSVSYAGGGGGSSFASATGGIGGDGGGGNGAGTPITGQSGTTNLGGGGGGTTYDGGFSGAGGSGVVILRLLTSEYSGTTTGSPTVTTDGNYSVLTYTGSGTYVHS